MTQTKKIKRIKAVNPGSPPDFDIDFQTQIRELVAQHAGDLYGLEKQANIITFDRYGPKGAFKAMCTLYRIPFAEANKVSALIPPPIEGVNCSIAEIFDPSSDRYSEGEDFRAAVAGDEWKRIIEGAMKIEGHVVGTGVHACGVIMSQKPLEEVIPLQVRLEDERVITQWTYPECEALGLVKMDFLGLDTVDIVQNAVRYIQETDPDNVPNMSEIIQGDLDDPKTFQLLQRGETIGVFQLASEGVQDLLKKMQPKSIDDIAATTALYRPGPMGMLSHVRYAERSSGRETVETPVHPEFENSPLETILGGTFNVVVFQEQVIQIASQIAGMTLQEGDDLRKAMGKKKIAVMNKMRPKFFEGAAKNGYSKEATQKLWDTIAEFAKYGFNKSHSYSYALVAYQAAYLKANHPVEFMASLLAQNVGEKAKILEFLKEAKRMRLKVGGVDVNESSVHVAPAKSKKTKNDIVYGFSGVDAVSVDVATLIVQEREKNGPFDSLSSFVTRMREHGITRKNIFENLAQAGAFDTLGLTRRGAFEALPGLFSSAKTKAEKGVSLFDMLGGDELSSDDPEGTISTEEWDFSDRVRREANVIGQYLTSHPAEKLGKKEPLLRESTISEIFANNRKGVYRIAGGVTDTKSKTNRRGGRTVLVSIDDGTGFMNGNLHRKLVLGLNKLQARESIKKMFLAGQSADSVDEDLRKRLDSQVPAISPIEKNVLYTFEVLYSPNPDPDGNPRISVLSMRRVGLDKDGNLPIRLRLDANGAREGLLEKLEAKLPKAMANRSPGKFGIHLAKYDSSDLKDFDTDDVYHAAISQMESEGDVRPDPTAGNGDEVTGKAGKAVKKRAKKTNVNQDVRTWPPAAVEKDPYSFAEPVDHAEFIELLEYHDTGVQADKTNEVKVGVERYLGMENYDFGAMDPTILE